MIQKPAKQLYHSFYHNYIDSAPSGDILEILEKQGQNNFLFFSALSDEQSDFRYQEKKWSIKEIVGHLSDSERIFCYRALSFARNEQTALPGFDENTYVDESFFSERSRSSIIDEHLIVRQATLSLMKNFSDPVWERIGNANGSQMALSAIPFIIYGHEQHHMNIIKERYLK